jgi:hypothetical protein
MSCNSSSSRQARQCAPGIGGLTRPHSERSLVGDGRSVCDGAMKRLGLVAGQRRQRRVGRDRPAVRARVGDRLALALISLALDDVDATKLIGGRRRPWDRRRIAGLLGDGGECRRFRGNVDVSGAPRTDSSFTIVPRQPRRLGHGIGEFARLVPDAD